MQREYGKNFFNELLIYILIITSLSLLFFKKKYNYSYFKSIIYGLIISLISLLMILLIIILMILLIHI